MVEPVSGLPIEDPTLIFGLATLSFLLAPLIFQRYRVPGIVGIILVGSAIGDNGLGILARGETIVILGEVGLVYLMFIAGLEINLVRFLEQRSRSLTFGLLSFAIPQGVGTLVGYVALELSLAAALLYASIFASHTLLAYPVVSRLGIVNDESITATIGGTIITDTLALVVLAVVVAGAGGDLSTAFWLELVLGLAAFFVGVWLLVPRLARWFFRTVDQRGDYEFLFVLSVLFCCSFLASLVHVEPIIGAFLAGLVLNPLIPHSGPLMNRIQFVGNALFIPFFLLSVGMLADVRAVVAGPAVVTLAASFVVLVVVTKFAAAWVTARLFEYSRPQLLSMFGLSLGQAAAALAIVLIGIREGIPGFDETMLNAVVLLILVASICSSAVVDRAGRRLARDRESIPTEGWDEPRRVMVAVAPDPQYGRQLIDLATTIRESDSSEPLYAVSVGYGEDDVGGAVAAIEDRLSSVQSYAAGADVPVDPEARIAQSTSGGITRAVRENRISTLLMEWDGRVSRPQRAFGETIDRVLARTTPLVLVSHLQQPLHTTSEVVVIVPPEVVYNDGFDEGLLTAARIASGLSAPLNVLVVGGDETAVSEHTGGLEDGAPTVTTVGGWAGLETHLEDETGTDTLVVSVSVRRGTMGWEPQLQRLPRTLSGRIDCNFIVLYLADTERTDDRRFLRFE